MARLIWEGQSSKATRRVLPTKLHTKAASRMDVVLNTATRKDCSSFPRGWRFKQLHGNLQGTYQVMIDGKYRIRFRWDPEQGAVGIIVGDFHDEDN